MVRKSAAPFTVQPKTPIFTASDIHRRGDLYGGWRLPEDHLVVRDDGAVDHHLQIIGRYLRCQVHHDPLVRTLTNFSGDERTPYCETLARAWNHSFRPGVAHLPFAHSRFTHAAMNPIATDHRLAAMQRRVNATIIMRLRLAALADVSDLDTALSSCPILWSDPDCLRGHQEAGIYADDWAMMQQLGLTAKLVPLARAARPDHFVLTAHVSQLIANSQLANQSTLLSQLSTWSTFLYHHRQSLPLHLTTVILNQLLNQPPSLASLRRCLESNLLVNDPVYGPALADPVSPAEALRWQKQVLHSTFQIAIAQAFTAISDLSDPEAAYLASHWGEHNTNVGQINAIRSDPQQAQFYLRLQQLGYGHQLPPAPAEQICPLPTPPPDSELLELTPAELALYPGWTDHLPAQAPADSFSVT